MIVLDLCAGTGSATQAFRDRGHDVDTLDIIGGHTFNMDVRKFKPWKKYDFIWSSPPCTEFSIAKGISCKDRNPDLSLVEACIRICKTAPYWILENPRDCLRYIIGKPVVTVKYSDYGAVFPTKYREGVVCTKPTDLWGCFPWFWSNEQPQKQQLLKDGIQALGSRSAMRAMVPYGLSLAICTAIERDLDVHPKL